MKRWKVVLKRNDVDILTISGLDVVFFQLLEEFSEKKEGFFTIFSQKTLTHYTNTNLQEWGQFLVTKYFSSPQIIKKYYQQGEELLQATKRRTTKKLGLVKDFQDFKTSFLRVCNVYSINSWLALDAWQKDYETMITQLLKRKRLEAAEEEKITASLFQPWKRTALQDIQDKLKKGRSAKELAQEYQQLRSWSAVWYREITEEWITGLKEGNKGMKEFYSYTQLIKKLKPTPSEKKMIGLAPYMIFFKDYRDDLRRTFNYYWKGLFEDLAKNFKVSYDDLGYLSLEELEKSINTGYFPQKIVDQRKRNSCLFVSKNKRVVIIDDIPKRYTQIVQDVEKLEKTIEVKGIVACKGKSNSGKNDTKNNGIEKTMKNGAVLRGKVVVIHSYHDLKKVDTESVLVSNTTHPNYLPAMQKAIAFITNEGGVISHAAIVAREMNKPCIVSTKNATKVLNDGDEVEIDIEKGIVRKI